MATNKNDKTILAIKDQIVKKKAELKRSVSFTPLTNCSLELDGQRYNIQAVTRDTLVHLLVKTHVYKMSADALGLTDTYFISGFKVNAWIVDMKAKLAQMDRKLEEDKLKKMEAKLSELLSVDKKVELEIDSIKAELNL